MIAATRLGDFIAAEYFEFDPYDLWRRRRRCVYIERPIGPQLPIPACITPTRHLTGAVPVRRFMFRGRATEG